MRFVAMHVVPLYLYAVPLYFYAGPLYSMLFSFALHFALRCRPVGSGFEFVICARRPAGGGLIILRVDSDVTVMGQDT